MMTTIGTTTPALLSRLLTRVVRAVRGKGTPRHESEDAASRLAAISESVQGAIFAVDRQWRFTFLNRAAEDLFGAPRERLLGGVIWEQAAVLAGSTWENELHRVAVDRVGVQFEAYSAPLDAWFETRADPSPTGLTVHAVDVTVRKRTERDLAGRLRQQATVAALGLHALSALELPRLFEEAVSAVSSTLEVELAKVLELSPDERSLRLVAGVGWREGLVGTADVDVGLSSQAGYTLANQGPIIVEDLRTETRFSGPPLLFEHGVISGLSVVIASGARPFGILGAHTQRSRRFSAHDVNFLQVVANVIGQAVQHHRATQELTESEARFRLLAETVNDAFIITDLATGRTEYVSPAFERIWGQRHEVLESDGVDAVHPDDRARVRGNMKRAAEGYAHEYRIVKPDGSIRWISSQVFPVPAADGRPIRRAVEVARDITERKEAEEIARRLHEERLARATAEAGLRARDEVLALVSHDLKNPLAAIIMSVEALEGLSRDPLWAKRLAVIGRAARRMSRLVDDLLDIARVEAGKMSLQLEQVELAALFAEVRDAFEPLVSDKGVSLDVEIARDVPPVCVDRDRIVRVIANLVGNAVKFTPRNGRVVLRAEPSEGRVVVSVLDTGPGVPESDRPHLFRPFWQRGGSDSRGAGLGLSIARGIVEAHGERIWMSSTGGGGATFSFTVSPAGAAATEADLAAGPARPDATASTNK